MSVIDAARAVATDLVDRILASPVGAAALAQMQAERDQKRKDLAQQLATERAALEKQLPSLLKDAEKTRQALDAAQAALDAEKAAWQQAESARHAAAHASQYRCGHLEHAMRQLQPACIAEFCHWAGDQMDRARKSYNPPATMPYPRAEFREHVEANARAQERFDQYRAQHREYTQALQDARPKAEQLALEPLTDAEIFAVLDAIRLELEQQGQALGVRGE